MNDFETRLKQALESPQNQGEMADADSVGTVGSPDCGDMLRMWLKFTEKDGQKIIDRASFQSFGCQTAIAVASMATQILKGKTLEQARAMKASELSGELGALPPMKIHCGQLVEGALKEALDGANTPYPTTSRHSPTTETLSSQIYQSRTGGVTIRLLDAP
jgi:NifU-like protein involved in Fe-S cluster formation